MKSFLGLLFLGAICAVTEAQQTAPTLLALDGAIGAGVPARVERFAGEPARIPAIFLASPAPAPEITADVYVDGDVLGAPWKKGVRFDVAAAPAHPALLEGSFLIPLPEGQNPALFRVQILAMGAEPNQQTKLAEFGLLITPAEELKQTLTRWIKPPKDKTAHILAVFGPVRGLREMLREWSLPFEDLGESMPANIPSGTCGIGEQVTPEEAEACEVSEGASLLLFARDPANPADVVQKIVNQRLLTVVNAPPPADWSHHPFFHHLLLTQIRLHQDHE